jgi:hypothetical protein
MNNKEFNNWLDQKNRRYASAEFRIQKALDQIKRLANGESIDEVLGDTNG